MAGVVATTVAIAEMVMEAYEAAELVEAAEAVSELAEAAMEESAMEDGASAVTMETVEGMDAMEYFEMDTPYTQTTAQALERRIANNSVAHFATQTGTVGLARAVLLRGEELTALRVAQAATEQTINSAVWYGMSNALWPGQPPHPEILPPGHKKEIESTNLIGIGPSKEPVQDQMFPKRLNKTLRWSSNKGRLDVTHTNAADNVSSALIVKANSCADIGGVFPTADLHEPMGWTQYKAMYDQYVVNASRLRVDFFVDEPTTTEGAGLMDSVCLGVSIKDSTAVSTIPGHYQELRDSVWQIAGPEHCGRLVYDFDPTKFFAVPKSNLTTDSSLRAQTATPDDPVNMAYFHVWGHHLKRSGITEAATFVKLVVTVEMDVTFFEPKTVAQS